MLHYISSHVRAPWWWSGRVSGNMTSRSPILEGPNLTSLVLAWVGSQISSIPLLLSEFPSLKASSIARVYQNLKDVMCEHIGLCSKYFAQVRLDRHKTKLQNLTLTIPRLVQANTNDVAVRVTEVDSRNKGLQNVLVVVVRGQSGDGGVNDREATFTTNSHGLWH